MLQQSSYDVLDNDLRIPSSKCQNSGQKRAEKRRKKGKQTERRMSSRSEMRHKQATEIIASLLAAGSLSMERCQGPQLPALRLIPTKIRRELSGCLSEACRAMWRHVACQVMSWYPINRRDLFRITITSRKSREDCRRSGAYGQNQPRAGP